MHACTGGNWNHAIPSATGMGKIKKSALAKVKGGGGWGGGGDTVARNASFPKRET